METILTQASLYAPNATSLVLLAQVHLIQNAKSVAVGTNYTTVNVYSAKISRATLYLSQGWLLNVQR